MKITTASLLTLGFLLPLISAQLTYYDNGYPPAPATRRVIIRNGRLLTDRSAAIQQAYIDDLDEPEPQLPQEPHDRDLEEPLVEEPVPTQRPLRNGNGFSQQPLNTFQRPTNGYGFSRIPQQPVYDGVGQEKVVGDDEGPSQSDEVTNQSREDDSRPTDVTQKDVSTEEVVTTFEEETTDDGFTPTEPIQRPLGVIGPKKTNGNGQKPLNGSGRKATNGKKPVNGSGNGKKAVNGSGNGKKAVNGSENGKKAVKVEEGEQKTDDGHSSGGDDHHDHHSGDPIQWLRDAIRGEPGTDYPIFFSPPETGFKCADQQWPGYYADVEARCQVFHICQSNGRSDAFLCPNGTIFSQQNFVCVWWFDFDCETAPKFFELNSQLYLTPEGKSDESSASTDGTTAGQFEDKFTTSTGGSAEEKEPGSPPQVTEQVPLSPSVSEDSGEVVSKEAPAEEVVPTTTLNGLRGTIGKKNGVKSGKSGIGVRKDGNGKTKVVDGVLPKPYGNGKRLNGKTGSGVKPSVEGVKQNGKGFHRNGVTTKPVNGSGRKTGKKSGNGEQTLPASPATSARNGFQKTRVNGQKRTNGGTKSVYKPTVQRAELDEESSNRHYSRGR